MYDQDKIRQRFVMVRTLVLPALVEKLVKFIPLLKLKCSFEFQFNNLEVFGNNVGLRSSTKFVYTFRCSASKLLTVLACFKIVVDL